MSSILVAVCPYCNFKVKAWYSNPLEANQLMERVTFLETREMQQKGYRIEREEYHESLTSGWCECLKPTPSGQLPLPGF